MTTPIFEGNLSTTSQRHEARSSQEELRATRDCRPSGEFEEVNTSAPSIPDPRAPPLSIVVTRGAPGQDARETRSLHQLGMPAKPGRSAGLDPDADADVG